MPSFRIGDHEFECRPEPPTYPMIRYGKAQQKVAKAQALAKKVGKDLPGEVVFEVVESTFDLALAVATDEERDRLESFFMTADLDLAELGPAVERLLTDYKNEADAKGDVDELPPGGRPSSSSAGPQSTSGPGRVVSFKAGTVSEAAMSSTGGASAAS
jgi:hypothetical protein